MSNNFEKREITRPGFCRGCDKSLKSPDEIIYTYSRRNRGQAILFCIPCAEEIGKLAVQSNDSVV